MYPIIDDPMQIPAMWKHNNQIAVAMLKSQFETVARIVEYVVADMTEKEWQTRLAFGDNLLGFLAWHVPAVQDFTLQTFVRGVPEVRESVIWQNCATLDTETVSFDIPLVQADAAAQMTSPESVVAYAYAVQEEACRWLDGLVDEDLSAWTNGRLHIAQSPQYKNVTFSDALKPEQEIWGVLVSACIGHARSHLGEIDAAKRQLRRWGA